MNIVFPLCDWLDVQLGMREGEQDAPRLQGLVTRWKTYTSNVRSQSVGTVSLSHCQKPATYYLRYRRQERQSLTSLR